jgi:transposase InsO family protein
VKAGSSWDPALLELSEGSRLVIDGEEWEVTCLQAYLGRVRMRPATGAGPRPEQDVTIQTLLRHPDCHPSTSRASLPAASRERQPAILEDLTDAQQAVLALRYAHLMEAETGFRSGDPLRALPGEPRPGYDPDTTTLTQRREAKAAELAALPAEEARMLGLERVSVRTLRRWAGLFRDYNVTGLISGSWVRRSSGHPSVTPEVRQAIIWVRQHAMNRSRTDMRTKHVLLSGYMAREFGPDVPVPSYSTLRRVWREWFGSAGARMKYQRSAAALEAAQGDHGAEHVVVHRPGQVVALDTTEMAVLVRDGVFGDPVPMHLTLALDVYTHSIVAFRLTLVSDTSTDVAMLLRDIMMPLPLRDGWGEDMEWPYPGVPAALVAEFAGHRVAALPFFPPETVTTDHGSVYKNHHLVAVQGLIGCNILPARVLRPTDKAAVERCFGAIQSLLFEYLPGWRGVDVADRGADPEAEAALTVDELEHLLRVVSAVDVFGCHDVAIA